MTYDSREESTYEGSPVELFLFDREGVQFWSYTSADSQQDFQGITYLPISIRRGNIEQSQDIRRNSLDVTMPITADFVQQYISSPPTDRVNLTMRRFHFEDTEVISLWIGRVINVEFEENNVVVRCEPIHTSIRRPTLRRLYQASCTHLLYGSECKVDRAAFRTVATLTAVSGLTLTSTGFGAQPDGYFTGGYVELLTAGVLNKRFILSHTGNDIQINLPLSGAAVGASVNAYPGCAHNVGICNSRFSNILNYGGQPFIPVKNPMGGTPIF